MNIILLCFFLISIIALLSTSWFNPSNEKYIDYKDYMSIPASAYEMIGADNGDMAKKKYYVEFKDSFFETALKTAKYSQKFDDTDYKISQLQQNRKDIELKVSQVIEKALNNKLPIEESNLFNIVKIQIKAIYKKENSKQNEFIVESISLVHRLNKVYGLDLYTKTHHSYDSNTLLDYKINGFVFEDKLYGDVLPSNMNEDTELSYDQMMKDKIIQSKEFEKQTFCKYVGDLKKFRNIDYKPLDSIKCD